MGKNSKKKLNSDILLVKGNHLEWQIIIILASRCMYDISYSL